MVTGWRCARSHIWCVALLGAACSEDPLSGDSLHPVRVELLALSSITSAPPRPFVSILDSLILEITFADGRRIALGQRLLPIDSVASFTVPMLLGRTGFLATILSNNDSVLHLGRTIAEVQPGSVIPVELVPLVPIMLASPDTVRVQTRPTGVVSDSFKIYNRGVRSLGYVLDDVTPRRSQAGDCAINCMSPRVSKSLLPAGDSVWVYIDSITAIAQPVTYTFLSLYGSLSVVVMRRE